MCFSPFLEVLGKELPAPVAKVMLSQLRALEVVW